MSCLSSLYSLPLVEAGSGPTFGHYDLRFYNGNPVSLEVQAESLHHLIVSYHTYLASIKIPTWLAHGTLLGWYWNGEVLPWDTDLDVQVWASDLYNLAKYNMTQYSYSTVIAPTSKKSVLIQDESWRTPSPQHAIPFKRKYLLDVNPHHVTRDGSDWQNVIDARWIDTVTGLFIDITGLSDTGANSWTCKNYHRYPKAHLNKDTLVKTYFEGYPAMVPPGYRPVLEAEYGTQSLVNEKFNMYTFFKETAEWVKDGVVSLG